MREKRSARALTPDLVPPRMYPDLHEHLEHLEHEGLLIRVKEPVDKDQEMHPLVRWQFRGGIKEKDRKAFLFEQPIDAKGKRYGIPVASVSAAIRRKSTSCGPKPKPILFGPSRLLQRLRRCTKSFSAPKSLKCRARASTASRYRSPRRAGTMRRT